MDNPLPPPTGPPSFPPGGPIGPPPSFPPAPPPQIQPLSTPTPTPPPTTTPEPPVTEEVEDELKGVIDDDVDLEVEIRERKADPKKRRKKKSKKNRTSKQSAVPVLPPSEDTKKDVDLEIEYVEEEVQGDLADMYSDVFDKFNKVKEEEIEEELEEQKESEVVEKKQVVGEGEDDKRPTKKERKEIKRLRIAVLKQVVDRPDVVEVHDANSPDPELLITLKMARNTVGVPRHWCQKRKYLQAKRGMEKSPFDLPDFIKDTGIQRIRDAYKEKEDAKKLKQKAKDRMQPKSGKMDINYQVLHDAFFKYQTKPVMSIVGDTYYENKELEVHLKHKTPGVMSSELKEALGLVSDLVPAPWLINMQRYGPPPAYPRLQIPGLNAPIPMGAQFGYHPGGWGKPPVDESGMPIYGNVFGEKIETVADMEEEQNLANRGTWGKIEDEESDEESDEEEESEEEEEGEGEEGEGEEGKEGEEGSGLLTPLPGGAETPDVLNLRKQSARDEPTKTFGTVLEEQEVSAGKGIFGSSHVYNLGAETAKAATAATEEKSGSKQKGEKMMVTLNPNELEHMEGPLTDQMIKKKYEEEVEREREEREGEGDDGLSEMVAEEIRNRQGGQSKKRKSQFKSDQKTKKAKESNFKF